MSDVTCPIIRVMVSAEKSGSLRSGVSMVSPCAAARAPK